MITSKGSKQPQFADNNKHCRFHGVCGHTTEECRVLAKDPDADPKTYKPRNQQYGGKPKVDDNRDKQL